MADFGETSRSGAGWGKSWVGRHLSESDCGRCRQHTGRSGLVVGAAKPALHSRWPQCCRMPESGTLLPVAVACGKVGLRRNPSSVEPSVPPLHCLGRETFGDTA